MLGSGGGSKKSVNQDINMIPFIDLLLVTVAFLLITAVWVTYERMNANAQIPGPPSDTPIQPDKLEKSLHINMTEAQFVLTWKQGATVISETTLTRPSTEPGGEPDYDDLAKKITDEWKLHGSHMNASDKRLDRAVLHTENSVPFKEIVAVMDAIYHTKRDMFLNNQKRKVPVFNMAFASR